MPEQFRNEVAIASCERVHLLDDGNPFHESDVDTETGFGADHCYDDDQSTNMGSQKWLRNKADGLRAEEEWDAARFGVDVETAADHYILTDNQADDGQRRTEENPISLSDHTEATDDDIESTSGGDLDI